MTLIIQGYPDWVVNLVMWQVQVKNLLKKLTLKSKLSSETKVNQRVISLFARQLGLMLQSGVPISQALDFFKDQRENEHLGDMVSSLAKRVSEGESLSHSMALYPRTFPSAFRSLISVGEETGGLAKSLLQAGQWLEDDYALFAQMKSAFTYPLFVFGTALLLTLGLFTTIVPDFLGVVGAMAGEPPFITRIVLEFTHILTSPGTYIVVLGIGILVWLKASMILKNPVELARYAELFLSVPVLGTVFGLTSLTRYAFSMRLLLEGGSTVTKSLRIAANASGNPALIMDASRLSKGLSDGRSLGDMMQDNLTLYDTRLVQMVRSGEETATLDDMFHRAGTLLSIELQSLLQRIPQILEPLLLLSVGTMVGTTLLALFLPLYSVLNQV